MKRILLISDTHGFLDPKLTKHIDAADEVWHAGDIGPVATIADIVKTKPFRAVYGNIDGQDVRVEYPENLIFDCEGVKTLMTHIAGYPGRYAARVKALIIEHKPNLVICGHSHILKVIYDKDLMHLHMNPGACGVHGFHQVKTALRFELDKGEIKNAAVIELGKRTSLT